MKLAAVAHSVSLVVGTAEAFSTLGTWSPHSRRFAPRLFASRQTGDAANAITDDIWDVSPPVRVQGNSLKTWELGGDGSTERVQVSLRSAGRPIDANVELWRTPSYIPTKFKVYCEDGNEQPFHCVIETPKHPNTVAVFNTECMDFPFEASVADTGLCGAIESFAGETPPESVQGGKVVSYTFGPDVESIQIMLKTNEKNMKAMIEITQGPNDDNQTVEVDSPDGYLHPFYTVIMTPGGANTLRIVNEESVEFPFDAYVSPYETASRGSKNEVVMGRVPPMGW